MAKKRDIRKEKRESISKIKTARKAALKVARGGDYETPEAKEKAVKYAKKLSQNIKKDVKETAKKMIKGEDAELDRKLDVTPKTRKERKQRKKDFEEKVESVAPKTKREKKAASRAFQAEIAQEKKAQDAERAERLGPDWAKKVDGISSLGEILSKESTIDGNSASHELAKTVVQDKTEFNEANTAYAETKAEIDAADNAISKDLTDKTSELGKAVAEAQSNNPNIDVDKEVAKGYDGDGKTIAKAAKEGDGQYDGMSMDDIKFQKSAAEYGVSLAKKKDDLIPDYIEKLGIENYYPNQGRNVIQANFTGSYIGSQTLTAAMPGLPAASLIDARKRALGEKAKKKAENNKKYWELFATAPQYQMQYNDAGYELLNKYGEAANWDFDALSSSSTELGNMFRKDWADYKAKGQWISSIDGVVTDMAEDLRDNADSRYATNMVYKELRDWRAGLQDTDAFLAGDKSDPENLQNFMMKLETYQNFGKALDEKVKTLNQTAWNEVPLAAGLSGGDIYDDEGNFILADNLSEAYAKHKDSQYHEWKSAMGKFIDVEKAEEVVRNMYKDNHFYEGADREQMIQDGTKQLLSHFGSSVSLEQNTISIDPTAWYKAKTARMKVENEYWNVFDQIQATDEDANAGLLDAINDGFNGDGLIDAMTNSIGQQVKKLGAGISGYALPADKLAQQDWTTGTADNIGSPEDAKYILPNGSAATFDQLDPAVQQQVRLAWKPESQMITKEESYIVGKVFYNYDDNTVEDLYSADNKALGRSVKSESDIRTLYNGVNSAQYKVGEKVHTLPVKIVTTVAANKATNRLYSAKEETKKSSYQKADDE
jgi:hypothetical protein